MSFHPPRERKALVRLADARHRPIDEHQLEILRVFAAELVQAPEDRADTVERFEMLQSCVEIRFAVGRMKQAEAFLSQGVEDVVLAGEVAVDGSRAVLDL